MKTISKSVLIESLLSMPDEVDIESVIEQILLLAKIERSRRQIDSGVFFTNDVVKESYKKWLK